MKTEFTPLNLPKPLVEELRIWKQAFSTCYGRTVSYGEMIALFLDGLDDTEPDVVAEMDAILQRHPELKDKVGKWPPER